MGECICTQYVRIGKIADLAKKMIRLMGLEIRGEANPDGDIEVVYTGLRPGEKLFEELLIGDNPQGTEHPRIMKAQEVSLPWVEALVDQLDHACHGFDCEKVRMILEQAPLGFAPNNGIDDLVWNVNRPTSDKPSGVVADISLVKQNKSSNK